MAEDAEKGRDDDDEPTVMTSMSKSHTTGRAIIIAIAGLALGALIVRSSILGLTGVARTRGVVRWPVTTCTLAGGAASVVTERTKQRGQLEWGRVYARVRAGERELIAFDTVDGAHHGHVEAARELFPRSGADQPADATLSVPCALNPAFSDNCTLPTGCSRTQTPLGGGCCSGRVVLGAAEELPEYVRQGQQPMVRVYFVLIGLLSLAGTFCHLCVFSAQGRARLLAVQREQFARRAIRISTHEPREPHGDGAQLH